MNEYDVVFLKEMIKHHEMALDMAVGIIKNGKSKTIFNMANKIILVQSQEITDMKQMLADDM